MYKRQVLIKYVADYDAYYDTMEDAVETDAAPANGCVIYGPPAGLAKYTAAVYDIRVPLCPSSLSRTGWDRSVIS